MLFDPFFVWFVDVSAIIPNPQVMESLAKVCELAWRPVACSGVPLLFASSACCCVSCRHDARVLPMRLKHLSYQTDAGRLSVWNCDICDILWRLERSSITDVAHVGYAWPNPPSPDRFRIWR